MKYSVEVMRVREQTIQLNGWAVESNPDSVITYRVEDEATAGEGKDRSDEKR